MNLRIRIAKMECLRRLVIEEGDRYGLCMLQSVYRIDLLDWLAITRASTGQRWPDEHPYWFPRNEEGKKMRLALVDQVLDDLRKRAEDSLPPFKN